MHAKRDKLQALHREGKLDEAKSGYLAILEKKPTDFEALHALGIICTQQRNYPDAIAYLEKALTVDPNNTSLQLNLANVYRYNHEPQKAKTLLTHLTTTLENYWPAFNNLAILYYELGNYDEAIKLLEYTLTKQPDYIDAYYNLGLTYIKKNQVDEAIQNFNLLLEKDSSHFAARFQLANLLMQKDRIKEALPIFIAIEAARPHHYETQMNLAACYLKMKNYTAANVHYQKALELSPEDQDGLFNLAVVNAQLGETTQAIQYYQQVIKINRDHFPAHNNIAVLFLTKGHFAFAKQHFQEALRIQPHNLALKHTLKVLNDPASLQQSDPDYIKSLFDAYADHYDIHLQKTLQYELPDVLLNAVRKTAFSPENKMIILDLGCGTGLAAIPFKPYAKKLIGVDLSEKMLTLAKEKNIYDQLIQGDIAKDLTQIKERVDLIIAADTFVYFGDLANIFNTVKQLLNANGLFVFNTEISEDADFQMEPSGRFQHQLKYIQQLTEQYQFQILHYQRSQTRKQNNLPVFGHIFVLKNIL